MFPLRDVNPTVTSPWVTVALIALNLGVFLGIQVPSSNQAALLLERAAIACEVTTGAPISLQEVTSGRCDAAALDPVVPDKGIRLSVLTSLFLHGGLAHVLFNMWFLWIFGNNVEEAFGSIWYLLLYMAGGVAATGAFVLANPTSTVPLVGASGAVAVALGAYAVLFPSHRLLTLVGWIPLPLPASLFLAVWFVAQFALVGTNLAWEAHAAGFVFGALVSLLFRRRLLARVERLHPPTPAWP